MSNRQARPGGGHSYSSSSHSSSSSSSHSSSSSSSHSSYTPHSSSSSSPSSSSSSSSSYTPSSSSSSSSSTPSTGYTSTSYDSPYDRSTYHESYMGTALLVIMGAFTVALLGVAFARMRRHRGLDVRKREPQWTPEPPPRPVDLKAIFDADPDFSPAVFEDLAFQLYAAAHRARADEAQLFALAPYLSPVAMAHLAARPGAIQFVVVGTLHIDRAETADAEPRRIKLPVTITANLIGADGKSVLAVEQWVFTRQADARSRPPVRTQTWPCPNCGAPWTVHAGDPRTCAHCGTAIQAGRLDWAVEQIWLESETSEGPTLTGTVEEQGNELPTVTHPDAEARLAAITADDPAVTWTALCARIELVYQRLNQGWNALDLAPARGLLTAAMLHYLSFWTSEYRRQDLRNALADAKVTGLSLAKVTRDFYFDAITVRVFATGHDFTVNAKDKVVGGSRTKLRPYTEYWTFLRSSTRRGPVIATPTCPNCGAELAITDAGTCTHCSALVDNGSFDWVLSKIEQDDDYAG